MRGGEQVAALLVVVVDQVRDDFGVGIRYKTIPQPDQPGPHGLVVLDDAVVHHRQAVLAHMRVGVTFGRRTVRGPAGVRDAKMSVD